MCVRQSRKEKGVHAQRNMRGKKNWSPLVGLEPTTFELEVQCANPLRHRGCYNVCFLKDVSNPCHCELRAGNPYQSLITLCNFSQMGENAFSIKVLKQKLYVDGMEYLLHETFGMENKAKPKSADAKKVLIDKVMVPFARF